MVAASQAAGASRWEPGPSKLWLHARPSSPPYLRSAEGRGREDEQSGAGPAPQQLLSKGPDSSQGNASGHTLMGMAGSQGPPVKGPGIPGVLWGGGTGAGALGPELQLPCEPGTARRGEPVLLTCAKGGTPRGRGWSGCRSLVRSPWLSLRRHAGAPAPPYHPASFRARTSASLPFPPFSPGGGFA